MLCYFFLIGSFITGASLKERLEQLQSKSKEKNLNEQLTKSMKKLENIEEQKRKKKNKEIKELGRKFNPAPLKKTNDTTTRYIIYAMILGLLLTSIFIVIFAWKEIKESYDFLYKTTNSILNFIQLTGIHAIFVTSNYGINFQNTKEVVNDHKENDLDNAETWI